MFCLYMCWTRALRMSENESLIQVKSVNDDSSQMRQ